MARIYIVEDNDAISEAVKGYLELNEHEVLRFAKLDGVIDSVSKKQPDLIIIDIMLPDGSGFNLAKQIRKKNDIPFIFLTARDQESDRITGFEIGADDYVVKPFEAKELIARVKAIIRRTKGKESGYSDIKFPDLLISKNTYTVILKDKQLELPPKEFELLYLLASNPNTVYTRDMLLEKIWGFDFFGDSRTVDVHIKRLREKINLADANWQLKTVWGVGYKFEVL